MKRIIDKNNYEEFFVDYLDGKLTVNEIVMLENFLLVNQDLRKELEGLERVVLGKENISFNLKDNLKQIDLSSPVNEDNFDFYCIAGIEGDLNDQQSSELQKYISEHPEKQNDQNTYKKLKLVPERILYKEKSSLEKSIFVVYRKEIYRYTALAAGIALVVSLFFMLPGDNINPSGISMVDETENNTVRDTTSAKEPAVISDDPEVTPVKTPERKTFKSKSDISFKVTIPIAVNEEVEKDKALETATYLSKVRINPESLNRTIAHFSPDIDESIKPDRSVYFTEPQVRLTASNGNLNLEQFAKQKFSSLVFGDGKDEEDFSFWSVTTAGINKINDLTGSNMKLDRSVDEEGKTDGLSFNSGFFSFSAPINRE